MCVCINIHAVSFIRSSENNMLNCVIVLPLFLKQSCGKAALSRNVSKPEGW